MKIFNLYILESDKTKLNILETFFKGKGFSVKGFVNKHSLIKYIHSSIPDVLVTDYMLDQGDSLELINEMRSVIKVIVCTTAFFDDEQVKLKLYLNGCVDVKPVNRLKELYTSIIQALNDEPNWSIDNVKSL